MADKEHGQHQEQVLQKRLEDSAKLERELSRRFRGKTTIPESSSPNKDSSSATITDQPELAMTEAPIDELHDCASNELRKSSRKRKARVESASGVLSSGIAPKAKVTSKRKASTKRAQKNHQSGDRRHGSLIDFEEQVVDSQDKMGTISDHWASMIHESSQLREALRINNAHQASTQSLACRIFGIPEQPLAVTPNVGARGTRVEHMSPSIAAYDAAQTLSGPSFNGLQFGAWSFGGPLPDDTPFAGWPFAGTPLATPSVYDQGPISLTTNQELGLPLTSLPSSSCAINPTLMDPMLMDPTLMDPTLMDPTLMNPAAPTSISEPVAVQAPTEDAQWAGLDADEQAVQQRRMNMTASERGQNGLLHYYHKDLQGVVIGDLWMTAPERAKFRQKQRRLGAPVRKASRVQASHQPEDEVVRTDAGSQQGPKASRKKSQAQN
ncbi:hypothetical protein KCV07_g3781, partial [Aureobasidium melanogenum]